MVANISSQCGIFHFILNMAMILIFDETQFIYLFMIKSLKDL